MTSKRLVQNSLESGLTIHYQGNIILPILGMKISKALFMINQVKNILPTDSLKTLYFAMINPHICYQIMAWSNSTCAERGKIQKLKKKAIRTIHKASYTAHTDPLFKRSKILKINDQQTYESLLFMYDYNTHKLPHSFNNMYITNHDRNPQVHTRQSNMLYIPRCDTNFLRHLPIYMYYLTRTWNLYLNTHPDTFKSRSIFKRDLKNELLSQYPVSVTCTNLRCRDCNM